MADVQQNPSLTPEVVKAKLNVALTSLQFTITGINDMERKLVYNEDNLENIKSFIEKGKTALDAVETKRVELKEKPLREGKMIDQEAKIIANQINEPLARANVEYTKLCKEIENRARLQKEEEDRKERIRKAIDTDILSYTQAIAGATTLPALTKIQSSINLAKGAAQGKAKYMEFHPEMIEKLEGLNESINKQKKLISDLEDLKKKQKSTKDEYEKEELTSQIQETQASINEANIVIQEEAINNVTSVAPTTYATEVLPAVKARRTTWKYEVVDINLLQKKMPHLVKLVVDEAKMNDLLKTKKADGSFDGKEELVINGIKFFADKLY